MTAKFESYRAQHPLPEDIQKMNNDETVCKFCGVSYLIHNEMCKLEDKVEELTAEVLRLRNQEKVINDLRASLVEKQQEISDSISKIANLENEGELEKSSKREIQQKYDTLSHQFSIYSANMANSQKAFLSINADLKSQLKLLRSSTVDLSSNYSSEFSVLKSFINQLASSYKFEVDNVEERLSSLQKQLESEQRDHMETRKAVTSHQIELEKYMELEKLYSSSKALYEKSRLEVDELSSRAEFLQTEKNSASAQMVQLKETLRSKQLEIENLNNVLRHQSESSEKALSWYKDQLKSKEDEMLTLLAQTNELRDLLKQKEDFEYQVKKKQNQSNLDFTQLKSAYSDLKKELEIMSRERDELIANHHARIIELKDAFARQNSEEIFAKKIADAVSIERERLNREKSLLKESLQHSFAMELDIEKEKVRQLSKNHSNDLKDLQNKLLAEFDSENLKKNNTIQDLKSQISKLESEHSSKILDLTKKINEAEKLANEKKEPDNSAIEKLENTLLEKIKEVETSNNRIHQLQDMLDDSKEQVKVLQETVQRECEERFELTDALASVKEQLLRFQLANTEPSAVAKPSRLPELPSNVSVTTTRPTMNPNPVEPKEISSAPSHPRRTSDHGRQKPPANATMSLYRIAKSSSSQKSNSSVPSLSQSSTKNLISAALRRSSYNN